MAQEVAAWREQRARHIDQPARFVLPDLALQAIAHGQPVIIPTAGRMLHNPYYTGDGPWYHMLVVTGYDQTYFYTNDVGTAKGERYPFPKQLLLDAIHDWMGQDERIGAGRKVMMTIKAL